MSNLIFTGLLSADRRFPYIRDNECIRTSIGFINQLQSFQEQFVATLMHRLCTRIIVFVMINSHQCVRIPVNAFHIRRLVTWGSFIIVDVENWLDNVGMYNGYMKNK